MNLPGYTNPTQVGRGGYGVVHRAFQTSLRRDVAIKVLSAGVLDGTSRQQFESEAQALGSLGGHPNIIEVHDFGFAGDGTPYLIMPYLDGGSLHERVRSLGRTGGPEALDLGIKIAGALESAHRRGIVHGDVKPDNILFNGLGEPLLCDFGIAVLHHRQQGHALPVGVTPGFSAPEVLDGAVPTPSSDIYGLAVTLSACLRGAPPDLTATAGPNDDLRAMGLPESLVEALDYGMLADTDQRARTAAEFGRVLIDVQRALALPESRMHVLPADGLAAHSGPGRGLVGDGSVPSLRQQSSPLGAVTPHAPGAALHADFAELASPYIPGSGGVASALGGSSPGGSGSATIARLAPANPAAPASSSFDHADDEPDGRSRRAIAGIVLAAVAVLGAGLFAGWWFLLRPAPDPLADADIVFAQQVHDPIGLQQTLHATGGREGDALLMGLWWSFADYCATRQIDGPIGECYDAAAEAMVLLQDDDPRDLMLDEEVERRRSVREGLPAGYALGLEQLDRPSRDVDLDDLVEGRPGVDPSAFCEDRSCAHLAAEPAVSVQAPFDRLEDPDGLGDLLTDAGDDLLRDASAVGAWWSLADWCHGRAAYDSLGACYDLAAELTTDLSGRDPRLVSLAADLQRATVSEAVPAGYEATQRQLDTTPARVPFDELIVGRPGVAIACNPSCLAVEVQLVKAQPREMADDGAAPAEPQGQATPVPTASPSPDVGVDPATPAELGGHPAPAPGQHLVIVASIGKDGGQGALDAAVASARSTAERLGLDPARVRVVDSDRARYEDSGDPVGRPGFWGIVIVGYTDAAEARGGVAAWRSAYGDAKYRGQIVEV